MSIVFERIQLVWNLWLCASLSQLFSKDFQVKDNEKSFAFGNMKATILEFQPAKKSGWKSIHNSLKLYQNSGWIPSNGGGHCLADWKNSLTEELVRGGNLRRKEELRAFDQNMRSLRELCDFWVALIFILRDLWFKLREKIARSRPRFFSAVTLTFCHTYFTICINHM